MPFTERVLFGVPDALRNIRNNWEHQEQLGYHTRKSGDLLPLRPNQRFGPNDHFFILRTLRSTGCVWRLWWAAERALREGMPVTNWVNLLDTSRRGRGLCYRLEPVGELQFYQYAHKLDNSEDALNRLKDLLCKGVRSLGFNLQDNVDRAIEDGHPNPELVQRLADILTKDIPVGDLCDDKKK